MSEIEKMYRNSGIKKIELDYPDNFEPFYPEFTAEKQLEITKFIGLHYGFQMLKNEAFDYIIATKIYVKYEYEYKGYGYGYDEAIANLVNNLWQDLTEEEKRQIKEILE